MILSDNGILYEKSVADPNANAAAYIALIEAAGATVTDPQKTILSEFYTAAEAAGYYSSLKRLYFPIWGVAAANAIDMISLTSGTFVGGVTHGTGYVEGNGSTGYFRAGNFGTLGLSKTNFSSVIGISQIASVDGGAYWGLGNSRFTAIRKNSATSIQRSYCANSTTSAAVPTGIISTSVDATRLLTSRRITSGYTALESVAVPAGTFPTGEVITMGYNLAGDSGTTFNPVIISTSRLTLYGWGTSLTDAQNETYSLNLKNLFEGCTGLTLP
jgi:hypothetical protein